MKIFNTALSNEKRKLKCGPDEKKQEAFQFTTIMMMKLKNMIVVKFMCRNVKAI